MALMGHLSAATRGFETWVTEVAQSAGIPYLEEGEHPSDYKVMSISDVMRLVSKPKGMWSDNSQLCWVILNGDGQALGIRSIDLYHNRERAYELVRVLERSGVE